MKFPILRHSRILLCILSKLFLREKKEVILLVGHNLRIDSAQVIIKTERHQQSLNFDLCVYYYEFIVTLNHHIKSNLSKS